MKTLINNLSTKKYLLILLFALAATIAGYSHHAKLTTEFYSWNDGHVGVNIVISSDDHEAFVLGSQNIRLFYNADHITLSEDNIESHLNKKSYSEIVISEHNEYDERMTINDADYDVVGFLSFNVSLTDDARGGEKVNASGKHIFTIHFDKIADFDPADITLAMPGQTEELATAFVEVAEWIDPITTKPMNLTLETSTAYTTTLDDIHISVGPNPTSDFIYILSDQKISSITIYSADGQKVMSKEHESNEAKVDMSGLTEGMYFVELEDAQGRIYIRQVAKA